MEIINCIKTVLLFVFLLDCNTTSSENNSFPVQHEASYVYRQNNGGLKVRGYYVNTSDIQPWLQDYTTESSAHFCNDLVNRFSKVLTVLQDVRNEDLKFQLCKDLLDLLQTNRARAIRDCKVHLLLSSPRYTMLRQDHCPQLPDFVGEYKKMYPGNKATGAEIKASEKEDDDEENGVTSDLREKSGRKGSIEWYSSDSKPLYSVWIWLQVLLPLVIEIIYGNVNYILMY